MGLKVCGALLAAFCATVASGSAQESKAPLYPDIFVQTDDSFSRDPSLLDFIAHLDKAAEARVRVEGVGEIYDPSALLPLMADQVEIFVGRKARYGFGRPLDMAFDAPKRLPAAEALDLAGRLFEGKTDKPIVNQRRGMGAIHQLLWDRTIGKTPWLDGRVCTASYGKLADGEFEALVGSTSIQAEDWLITVGNPLVDAQVNYGVSYVGKANQMAAKSPNVRRDGGWEAILTPEGFTVHVRSWPWEARYVDYVNSHICFEKQGETWKVSAIAIRVRPQA